MAFRTNDILTQQICPLKKSTDDYLPFIEAANSLVTNVCVNTISNYADSTLELIERWLSAHFYCIMRNQWKFRSAGKVQESVDSKVDLGLDQTRYGQQAKILDYKGNLAALENKLRTTKGAFTIGVIWLGFEQGEEPAL